MALTPFGTQDSRVKHDPLNGDRTLESSPSAAVLLGNCAAVSRQLRVRLQLRLRTHAPIPSTMCALVLAAVSEQIKEACVARRPFFHLFSLRYPGEQRSPCAAHCCPGLGVSLMGCGRGSLNQEALRPEHAGELTTIPFCGDVGIVDNTSDSSFGSCCRRRRRGFILGKTALAFAAVAASYFLRRQLMSEKLELRESLS